MRPRSCRLPGEKEPFARESRSDIEKEATASIPHSPGRRAADSNHRIVRVRVLYRTRPSTKLVQPRRTRRTYTIARQRFSAGTRLAQTSCYRLRLRSQAMQAGREKPLYTDSRSVARQVPDRFRIQLANDCEANAANCGSLRSELQLVTNAVISRHHLAQVNC